MKTDSNWGELMQTPKARSVKRFVSSAWAFIVIIGGVLGGGISMGCWLGTNDERTRANIEIERLQYAYGYRLGTLAGKTEKAAEDAASAATTAQEAAGTVGTLAATVSKAARAVAPAAHPSPKNERAGQ